MLTVLRRFGLICDDQADHGHAGTLADFTDFHFHFHPLGLPARRVLHCETLMTLQASLPGPVYPVTSLAHGLDVTLESCAKSTTDACVCQVVANKHHHLYRHPSCSLRETKLLQL